MDTAIDWLLTRQWWVYDPAADWYAQPYHWINLIEGSAWLVFAAMVLHRYLKRRHAKIEIAYAVSFLTFALSDFREAYAVHSWLILFKAINLALIVYWRWIIIGLYYPTSKMY